MAGFESIGKFGDPRLAERGAWLYERIVATGSLVIREIGAGRAGELAAHRFLSSPSVTVDEIVETLGQQTGERCRGRRIVAAQDTSEVNFGHDDAKRRGLGRGGDGVGPGFFIHPVIAVDADDEAVLGLLDAQIWSRQVEDDGSACKRRRQRRYEDKESQRWLTGAMAAAKRAAAAAQLIVIGDRESDIYPLFVRRPEEIDIIVRASQNRAIEDGERLFAQADAWPELCRYQVVIPGRKVGEAARVATMALRAGGVLIKRPRNGFVEDLPKTVQLTFVDAREVDPPDHVDALHWRLLTTLSVADADGAKEVVHLYRLRWRIEQTFRALKSDGLGLPDTQIEKPHRLFKLTAIALGAALRTIQLVDARDGGPRPASDVADPHVIKAVAAIVPTLEGKTERQKNLHPPGSLSWLAWAAARLGGWNCYYKPPGPKTMRKGWDRLAAMVAGYYVARPELT